MLLNKTQEGSVHGGMEENHQNHAPRGEFGMRQGGAKCSLMSAPWMYRSEIGIVILRLGAAGMMLSHGWPKLLLLLQGHGAEWMNPIGIGSTLSLLLCTFAEFFCSLAIFVGLFTRLAALALVLNFWVILFIYGAQNAWAQNELPLLYLFCFAALLCTGAGPLSLDRLLARRWRCRPREGRRA